MKIVLLRHGKPKIPELGKLAVHEFHDWITAYNSAPLDSRSKPAKETVEMAKFCNTIVCSDLPRSIESAQRLEVKNIHCIDVIFREFELPSLENIPRYGVLKFSPDIWAVLYRILWFMGYASHCESFATAKQRAHNAANILHKKAEHSETVFLVGHSLLNSFIAKQLRAKGWQGSISLFNKHWEMSVFEQSKS